LGSPQCYIFTNIYACMWVKYVPTYMYVHMYWGYIGMYQHICSYICRWGYICSTVRCLWFTNLVVRMWLRSFNLSWKMQTLEMVWKPKVLFDPVKWKTRKRSSGSGWLCQANFWVTVAGSLWEGVGKSKYTLGLLKFTPEKWGFAAHVPWNWIEVGTSVKYIPSAKIISWSLCYDQ
jgi:hypothetical protein